MNKKATTTTMLQPDTPEYEMYFLYAKAKFISEHHDDKFLFEVLEYYQDDTLRKIDFFNFNELEFERFIFWFLLHRSERISTLRKYVNALKKFLKEYYIFDVKLKLTDLASKLRVLTHGEIWQIRMTLIGFRSKIFHLLEFMIETGCEYGKFELLVQERDWELNNFFANSDAPYILQKYKGKMPVIPKRDFDDGVRELLKMFNINRLVKVNGKMIPIYDMNIDLLISNTFIYRASHRKLPQSMICEMFKHEDISHFFPAISCINNQLIEVKYSESTVFGSLLRLIIVYEILKTGRPYFNRLIHSGSNLFLNPNLKLNFSHKKSVEKENQLRRFQNYDFNIEDTFFLEPAYLISKGFNFSERILTGYSAVMKRNEKKLLN